MAHITLKAVKKVWHHSDQGAQDALSPTTRLTHPLGGLQWEAEAGIKSAWATSLQPASAAAWHLITEQRLSAGQRSPSISLM